MTPAFSVAIFVGLAAAIEDLWRRRISNWIPASAFVAGVTCLAVERGWRGALSAIVGAVGGFCVFLVFYWLGGMGGGDVKLMAGLGAVLGMENVIPAALWTAAFGGVIAAMCIATVAVRSWMLQEPAKARPIRNIPYAPAIALGAWLALFAKV